MFLNAYRMRGELPGNESPSVSEWRVTRTTPSYRNDQRTAMNEPIDMNRRTVLKATGGLLSLAGVSSPAAANGTQEKNYGNGNGLGVFLNEQAAFKDHPVWDGAIVNRMGESVVDVAVGALTAVSDPHIPVDEAPFAFAPQVVKVSPGATVRWTWVSNPFGFPIPHDVRSLVDDEGEPVLELEGNPRFQSPPLRYKESPDAEEPAEDELPTFEVSFTERGNHLYFCTPHGAPFEFHDHYNAFGMRGAVQVAGKPL